MLKNWKAVGITACCGLALSTGALAQPVNNNCADAGLSPIPAAGGTVMGTTVDATNDGAGCGSSGLPGFDVYHAFAPAANGPWKLSLCATPVEWDSVLSIHTGCPASAGNLVAGSCRDDNCGTLSELPSITLVASTPYIVRVSTYNSTGLGVPSPYTLDVTNLGVPGACCATSGSCTFSAGGPSGCVSGETFQPGGTCSPTNTCPQPPSNDNCANAGMSPIPGAGGIIMGTTVSASPEAAFNDPACGSTNGQDVWHAWTPDDAGPWKIQTCGTTPTWDSVVSVHQGCPTDNTNNNLVACNDDFCAPLSSIESVALSAATPYVVRVSTYSSGFGPGAYTLKVINLNVPGNCCLAGACTLTMTGSFGCDPSAVFTPGGVCDPNPCPQPPANDACETATVVSALPFNSGTIPIGLATADVDVLCNSGSATGTNNGVWFTYTPAANCIASINHTSFDGINAVFTGACGVLAEQTCTDDATLSYSMLGGTQYYILVGAWSSAALATSATTVVTIDCVAPPPPPANDACAAATVIGSIPFNSGAISIGGAAADANVACNTDGATQVNNGIWFSYTPASNCTALIGETGSLDSIQAVYTGTCGGLSEIQCFVNENGNSFAATGGTTYYVLVGLQGTATAPVAGTVTFTLDCGQPPANDLCTGAISIPSVPYTVPAPIPLDFASDDVNVLGNGDCNADNLTVLRGVWFTYTATADGLLQLREQSGLDSVQAVFTGTDCNALTFLSCSDGEPVTGDEFYLVPATTGTTYYILVGKWGATPPAVGSVVNFSLDFLIPPAPPANDLCSAATVVPSVPYDSGLIDVFSATNDANVDASCDQGAGPLTYGIWWSYTPVSNIMLGISGNPTWNTVTSIWTGADCNTLTEVGCAGDPSSYLFLGGVTHYICTSFFPNPINGLPPIDTAFRLSLQPLPANDGCSSATDIGPSGTASGESNTILATNDGAVPSAGACNDASAVGLNNSIWFKFTPAVNGQLNIQVDADLYDALVVLYTGADCNSLTEIPDNACDGDGDLGFPVEIIDYTRPLTAGATYYIGIGNWGPDLGGGLTHWSFTFTPDAPANDNCCRGTTCNAVAAGTCTGTIAGSNSLVVTSCGAGNAFASCCYADFNHDGTQSIDDLFLYFNAYFTGHPLADFGGDGTSQPTIDDLFLYINAYFGTCS